MGQLDSAVAAVEAASRSGVRTFGVRSEVQFVHAITGKCAA